MTQVLAERVLATHQTRLQLARLALLDPQTVQALLDPWKAQDGA